MVNFFNFYYFLYITLAIILLIGLYYFLRKKSVRFSSITLFCILLSSFILHFVKLSFGYYKEWMPVAIRTITPENICAVSVLVFPWFFLSKKKILKDYMFYVGMMSGLGATFFPVDVIGYGAFDFETMRFYFSHILLWVVPLLMVILKLHTLEYKRIIKIPFLMYFTLCIILVNEVILTGAGFVHLRHLFSSEFRNSSFIFGPLEEVSLIGKLFIPLTPKLFTTVPVGINAGNAFYWPIIWLVIPSFIYVSIVSFLLSLPFEFGNVKKDLFVLIKSIFRKLKSF